MHFFLILSIFREGDREKKRETLIHYSNHFCVHCLFLIYVLTGNGTHNFGSWRWCSHQVSYLASAYISTFLIITIFCLLKLQSHRLSILGFGSWEKDRVVEDHFIACSTFQNYCLLHPLWATSILWGWPQ